MIFRKIADEYDDSYWKNFYENCAEGKFPKDVIYTNDSISVKVKKEWKIYPISKHSEEKQISDITSVFSEYFDISREVSKSNRKTKRNVDDTMIQNFIDKIRENNDIDDEEEKKIIAWIKIYVFLKLIAYEDFTSKGISGLKYEKDGLILDREIPDLEIPVEKNNL